MREPTVNLCADTSGLLTAIQSLKHFVDISLEVRNRFLDLGDSLAQVRSVDMGDSPTGAREIRVFLEPSDGLADLLSACLAGDFHGL